MARLLRSLLQKIPPVQRQLKRIADLEVAVQQQQARLEALGRVVGAPIQIANAAPPAAGMQTLTGQECQVGQLNKTATTMSSVIKAPAILEQKIFVICTPKSGSSFVVTFLQNVTGAGHHNPIFPGDIMLEADPYLPALEAVPQSAVSQLHCYAKQKTVDLCERFSIRPIFITRNIFDSLLSWKEYIDARPEHREVFPHYYEQETEEERNSFLLGVYTPIFIRMVASWHEAFRNKTLPIMWCTYEEFFADPLSGAQRMLDHLGLVYSNGAIETALRGAQTEPEKTKRNKGISNRGLSAFTEAERRRVLDLVASFKGFDAESAGILNPSDYR